jgi:UDP-glucose 6-dehydrogenase
MRINVIGYGTVGKAQAFLLQRLGHGLNPLLFEAIKKI